MDTLAAELRRRGTVIVTTSTHIRRPADYPVLTSGDEKAVSAAFLLHFAAISGYRPRLSHCVRCGRAVADDEIRLMDVASGGLLCPQCADGLTDAHPVTAAQVAWMRDVLRQGIDKTALPDGDAPGLLLAHYVECRLEKKLRREHLF